MFIVRRLRRPLVSVAAEVGVLTPCMEHPEFPVPTTRGKIWHHNRRAMKSVDDVFARVRAEYLEMPGLKLTAQQVARLCGIDGSLCRLVLDSLVEERFLCRKSDGMYVRLTDGELPRPRPAKVALAPHYRHVAGRR